jgi:2-polyprenyl-3-methyl-5-hydroxy-6-metoxy-1,4-benzoquinol methylase
MTLPSFTETESREGWNRGAAGYDDFIESGADWYRLEVHGPALLAACGEVRGRFALDLGCGQGYFTRQLARSGAAVIGVDLSDALVDLARAHEQREPLGATYHALSAAEVGTRWVEGQFDLVTSCMAVQDMADVAAVLRGAFEVLRPNGRMVFSVPHPLTDLARREWERDPEGRKLALRLAGYFESGPASCDWSMPRLSYHWDTPCWRHTFGEWSALIADAGFLVRRMHEPRPTPEQVERRPELMDCAIAPYFLVFDLVKG